MANWTLENKPNWLNPDRVYRTARGWEYEHDNGLREVIVAISNLEIKGNQAHDEEQDNLTLGDGFDLLIETYVAGGDLPQFLKI